MKVKGIACLTSKAWWGAAAVRALKTVAQTTISTIAVNTIWDIDFRALLGVVVLSGMISVLTSLAGIPEVTDETEGIVIESKDH